MQKDKLTFPFVPPMEDLRMHYTTDKGVEVYIFDTYCKNETPAERRATDTRIMNWYNDVQARRAAEAELAGTK